MYKSSQSPAVALSGFMVNRELLYCPTVHLRRIYVTCDVVAYFLFKKQSHFQILRHNTTDSRQQTADRRNKSHHHCTKKDNTRSGQMSNKFTWEEYNVPCLFPSMDLVQELNHDKNPPSTEQECYETTASTSPSKDQEEDDDLFADCDANHDDESTPSFMIRHLRQGATGARKTWPAAEVLLDYLVCRGGLRDLSKKVERNESHDTTTTLNFMHPPKPELHINYEESKLGEETYNIVELGGGTGFLSIGLAMALNSTEEKKSKASNMARLVCTDNDRATIKNMRFNILNQPAESNMNKAVKVSNLDWATDIGGERFGKDLKSQFRQKSKYDTTKKIDMLEHEDPTHLISHLVASDVHYGKTTLEPLSSVISAVKLRNPKVIVIIMMKERAEGQVQDLKERIEEKIGDGRINIHNDSQRAMLEDFHVSVRSIAHEDKPGLKLIEC